MNEPTPDEEPPVGDLFHMDDHRLAVEWESCQWMIDQCDDPAELKRAQRRQTDVEQEMTRRDSIRKALKVAATEAART